MNENQTVNGEEIAIVEANRFSNFVNKSDVDGIAALVTWRDWFLVRGINAVIAYIKPRTIPAGRGYALYRNGLLQVEAE